MLYLAGIPVIMDKKLIWVGMVIGSTLGGYVPALFGVDIFSFTSLIGTLVGGILGIWIAIKIGGE